MAIPQGNAELLKRNKNLRPLSELTQAGLCEFCARMPIAADVMAGSVWFVCAKHDDMQPVVSKKDAEHHEIVLNELRANGQKAKIVKK